MTDHTTPDIQSRKNKKNSSKFNTNKSSMAPYSQPRDRKSGKSSPRLACVVLSYPLEAEYGLFVTDLNGGSTANGGGFEFEPRFPQVRFVIRDDLRFCAVKSMLYLIDPCSSVYTFELSEKVLGFQNCKFEKHELVPAPPLKSSKSFPILIRYLRYIVVCSTKPVFVDERNADTVEFEVYDIDGKMSRALPPLLILPVGDINRRTEPRSYELYGADGSTVIATFTGSRTRLYPYGFDLGGVSIVNKNTLLVQTEMGTVFSLDLQSPNEEEQGWKVWDEGWLENMPMPSSPFSVIQNRICLSSGWAYDMTIRDAESKFKLWRSFIHSKRWRGECDHQYMIDMKRKFRRNKVGYNAIKALNEVNRSIPLPVSPVYKLIEEYHDYQCEQALVGDRDCILAQLVNESTKNYPHLVIDVLKLDPSKFPKLNYGNLKLQQEEYYESWMHDQKWAKLVKSFKFVMPKSCGDAFMQCVLPLWI